LALVLSLEFSRQGASLAVIDADPNAVIADWAARREEQGRSVPFTVVSRPKEAEMVATIGELPRSMTLSLLIWKERPLVCSPGLLRDRTWS
jgi:chromosome partitioning protein